MREIMKDYSFGPLSSDTDKFGMKKYRLQLLQSSIWTFDICLMKDYFAIGFLYWSLELSWF